MLTYLSVYVMHQFNELLSTTHALIKRIAQLILLYNHIAVYQSNCLFMFYMSSKMKVSLAFLLLEFFKFGSIAPRHFCLYVYTVLRIIYKILNLLQSTKILF